MVLNQRHRGFFVKKTHTCLISYKKAHTANLWAKAHSPECSGPSSYALHLKGPQQLGCTVEANLFPRTAHPSNLKRRKQATSLSPL